MICIFFLISTDVSYAPIKNLCICHKLSFITSGSNAILIVHGCKGIFLWYIYFDLTCIIHFIRGYCGFLFDLYGSTSEIIATGNSAEKQMKSFFKAYP